MFQPQLKCLALIKPFFLLWSLHSFFQENSTTPDRKEVRVVVDFSGRSSDTVIAIPPDTSWAGKIALNASNTANDSLSADYTKWMQAQPIRNGLKSEEMRPWHLILEYDQFDEDGDNVHSGVIEEFWASATKYKIIYKSDSLNQTDYGTDHGLFRLGDQQWPNRAETQARMEVVDPFHYAATLHGFHMKSVQRIFGTNTLDCEFLEKDGVISFPTQYCFEHNGSALRYVRGEGWYQTVYNGITSIDGRSVGKEVDVTDGGHPFLKIRLKTLETISTIDESNFTPPDSAVDITNKRVSGVAMKPIKTDFPEWPESLKQQHFKVTVEIVIGKDGHVISAHAANGLHEAYKSAENSAKKWTFQPYLIMGNPVEVESKVELSNN